MSSAIVMIADTHLPKRAKVLPRTLWRAIEEANLVLHACDWVDAATLDELQKRAFLTARVESGSLLDAQLQSVQRD